MQCFEEGVLLVSGKRRTKPILLDPLDNTSLHLCSRDTLARCNGCKTLGTTVLPLSEEGNGQLPKIIHKVGLYLRQ
jgi:hypothetical protein